MDEVTTIRKSSSQVAVMLFLLISRGRSFIAGRIEEMDNDRGDIPGWAIASAAACVFGAIVYAAVSGVVTKYVGRIK